MNNGIWDREDRYSKYFSGAEGQHYAECGVYAEPVDWHVLTEQLEHMSLRNKG